MGEGLVRDVNHRRTPLHCGSVARLRAHGIVSLAREPFDPLITTWRSISRRFQHRAPDGCTEPGRKEQVSCRAPDDAVSILNCRRPYDLRFFPGEGA